MGVFLKIIFRSTFYNDIKLGSLFLHIYSQLEDGMSVEYWKVVILLVKATASFALRRDTKITIVMLIPAIVFEI